MKNVIGSSTRSHRLEFVVVIGQLQPVEDSYGDFARVRETDESGAILVRPDHHVGWRTKSWDDAGEENLETALRQILAI